MNADTPALKIVIMAGGTGGHVFPALAVAEKLRARGVTLNWLGTARGLEAELVPNADITLHCLPIEGVRGRGLAAKLRAPWLLLRAVLQARKILQQIDPDAVLGFGGFASGPGGVAAWLLGKPLLIHEQNAVAGTTNRWLARLASKTLAAFPGSLAGAVQVGNPVRESIAGVKPLALDQSRPLHLLVLGGSLGALALNQLLPEAIALLPHSQRPEVKHQCGRRHVEVTESGYNNRGVEAEVMAFIDDMAAVYEWADLVVCRAGALTIAELTLAGRGALLVPYPHAIDDHQTRNAQWLEDSGAALLRQQSDLSASMLAEFIEEVSADRPRLLAMAQQARSLGRADAAKTVADYCEQTAREGLRKVAHG
ncbi:MAG: undecaprenyldiphospho-muramoylpentapeptide beta-N-acetylglucosaminyltransferase [Gammaproteobacteria bacterium]|uniref:undecaprenyldiphospho-muramoylpentapeptide beta-N-acetylglucosaminyltransferase n=1 Tax=Pseudomaricurvus alcaniphilus TaxID=1166482 RepID=UPI001409D661|nr:undecaprenyldiphospho-muramoylpentapeptide beta-N-acetylglucosaminyltransferase [Pseudomaricurvus alcaniphilus]MBR9909075.1 undecaprenyldiphospho-muramoylpentapeptide beta-N-acetylglucosaminyltransferase [Gammaproteobacteria bacterium]NHN38120.1 undecaprenyldiphospho-muramoylpentapeptide beta-N-acetylglucosaminyltransferase [Pseudomaricurvus alcaniphilus]